MIFDMNRQIALFLFSLINGMVVGILYDFYRVIRGFEKQSKIIVAIQDILFWILTGIIVFILMMYTNYAYMSFNVFMYGALGFIVYLKFVSEIAIISLDKIVRIINTIIRIVFNWVFYPLRIIFHKLSKNQ